MFDLREFRSEKDGFFATHTQSPLTITQKRSFNGLAYFPEDPQLRFEVQVERFSEQVEVQIPTSTGEVQAYKRYGKFRFQVDGQDAELTIFAAPHAYFLPFVDRPAGEQTYPAGRYLEPQPLGNDRFLIEFNLTK